MKKTLLAILMILVLSVFVSCAKDREEGCPAVKALQDGSYILTLDLRDETSNSQLTVAKKDGVISLDDGDTVTLLKADGCWVLDPAAKEYCPTDSVELSNLLTVLLTVNLRYEDTVKDGQKTQYRYAVSETTNYTFVYEGERFSEIRITVTVNGEVFSESVLPVESFSTTVPEDVLFEIPDGYTKVSSEKLSV